MTQGISNRKKFQLLLAALGVLPFLIYWLSISDTVVLIKDCSRLEKSYEQVGDIDRDISILKGQLTLINQELGSVGKAEGSFQTELLSVTTDYCHLNGLEVVGMTRPVSYLENDLLVETIPIKVEGGFLEALGLIHHLETDASVGRMISVEHRLEKKTSSRKKVLHTTVHLQRISKRNERI